MSHSLPAQPLSRRARGAWAEGLAANHLIQQGLSILARNIRAAGAEIDLLCLAQETLVFVEVRAREEIDEIHPLETVTKSKQSRIIRAAKAYLQSIEMYEAYYVRFDVIAVSLATQEIEWIVNAFGATDSD